MKNYDLLKQIVDDFKATRPVFTIAYNERYANNIDFNKINETRAKTFENFTSKEALFYDLSLSLFKEKFNKDRLIYEVKYNEILTDSIAKIKTDLRDLFINVCPNKSPTMTKAYKTINDGAYEELPREINELMISIWLYYKQSNKDEKTFKNLYGLLCLTAEKIKK